MSRILTQIWFVPSQVETIDLAMQIEVIFPCIQRFFKFIGLKGKDINQDSRSGRWFMVVKETDLESQSTSRQLNLEERIKHLEEKLARLTQKDFHLKEPVEERYWKQRKKMKQIKKTSEHSKGFRKDNQSTKDSPLLKPHSERKQSLAVSVAAYGSLCGGHWGGQPPREWQKPDKIHSLSHHELSFCCNFNHSWGHITQWKESHKNTKCVCIAFSGMISFITKG